MIGALRGTIFSKNQNPIILFVNGVGYRVHVTDRFLEETEAKKEVFLFIHSHIREDVFDLFGFPTIQELHLFELLLGVAGVGPKTSLSVLQKGVSLIEHAIRVSDVDFFTTVPRLGKKNAQKIIIDLKSKLGSLSDLDLSENRSSETKELIDGLVSMGFAKSEALSVIKTLPPRLATLQEKLRYCLRQLGKPL